MTNEEAKEILSKINIAVSCGATPILSENQIIEATNVAIKALEQQPCEDCISRAEALHACCDEWNKDYKAIMKSIRQLPSVTPKAESEEGD